MSARDAVRPPAMMDLAEAARAVSGTVEGANVAFSDVTTDSRSVGAGDLFVALAGERFDGHGFVAEAMRRGAAAALTSRRVEIGDALRASAWSPTRASRWDASPPTGARASRSRSWHSPAATARPR